MALENTTEDPSLAKEIEAYLACCIAYQGKWSISPPVRLFKKDDRETDTKVWAQACELLQIMGIPFRINASWLSIMVYPDGDPLFDQHNPPANGNTVIRATVVHNDKLFPAHTDLKRYDPKDVYVQAGIESQRKP